MVLDVNWWKENVKLLRYSVDVYVDDYEEGEGEQAGTMRLAARSDEVGENEADIDAIVEGEQSQIAFNSRYLVDVLNSLDGKVTLETSSPSSPGTIKPVENGYMFVAKEGTDVTFK